MLKEFVDRILDLAKTDIMTFEGLRYSPRPLSLIQLPLQFSMIELHTLSGLVDAIRHKLDALKPEEWMLIVRAYDDVILARSGTDSSGRRETLINVALKDGDCFPFNKFLPREEFVIGMQSRFAPDGATAELLRLTSSLEASTVALAEDDGISQRTTVKQGIALKEQVTVKGRRTLRPYRTFREVEQPASEFVFRLRSLNGEVPWCALFEADGGKWKLDAVLKIKAWLEAEELKIPIIA